jgi:RNA polymerase sigma factor (sigma-70 family)
MGDSRDLEALFRDHAQAVLGYALRRGASPEDAAEIVSEVMLVAWRKLGEVPRGPEARFWLLAAARFVLANQSRSERRRTNLGARLRAELSSSTPEPVEDELGATVRAAMGALPEGDREVLLLAAWEDLRPSEIAQVLSIPAETARSRLHRARARLREALDPHFDDAGRLQAVEEIYAARKEGT